MWALFNRFELNITRTTAEQCSHPGDCDADVRAAMDEFRYRRQLAKLDPDAVRDELGEYGAWDATELADDAMNLVRLFWIACGNIIDDIYSRSHHA
jgi:hypothetical protein